jgi:hypothetical protein
MTLDFASGGVEFALNDVKVENRDSHGLALVTTGADPMIVTSTPEIPLSQVKHITLEARITPPAGKSTLLRIELYVATALLPEFCPFASTALPPITNGKTSVATSDIMAWNSFGTPLTRIRIDPGGEPGIRVVLRRLVLSGN